MMHTSLKWIFKTQLFHLLIKLVSILFKVTQHTLKSQTSRNSDIIIIIQALSS